MLKTTRMEPADAMGYVALWGFSPAIDFAVGSEDVGEYNFWTKETSEPINILLAGAPDLCHVVQNLPEALRSPDRPVNFYILENSVEVYARQLLLLWLLAEPADSVGLQEKVWMYMEIVGNTLVRPSTASYIASAASQLTRLVTGSDGIQLPFVSLANLKYRELDQLESVFRFWRAESDEPNVARMWELRLRCHLEQRYDARGGVFDWDYFMRLKDRLDHEFVQPAEYKRWRETGVAFQRPGTEPTCPNRTLVTVRALGRAGERQLRRGYWGDLVSGPYTSWGVRTDDPQLRGRRNGRIVAAATDVYAANLEVLCGCLGERLSAAGHVRVHLLPCDGGALLGRRPHFRRLFDAAVLSSGMGHVLTPALAGCLRRGGLLLMETARYLVSVSGEQQRRLLDKYAEMADTAGCWPAAARATAHGARPAGDQPRAAAEPCSGNSSAPAASDMAVAAETGDQSSAPAAEAGNQSSAPAAEAGDQSSAPAAEARDQSSASAAEAGDQSSAPAADAGDQSSAPAPEAGGLPSAPATEAGGLPSAPAAKTEDQTTVAAERRDESSVVSVFSVATVTVGATVAHDPDESPHLTDGANEWSPVAAEVEKPTATAGEEKVASVRPRAEDVVERITADDSVVGKDSVPASAKEAPVVGDGPAGAAFQAEAVNILASVKSTEEIHSKRETNLTNGEFSEDFIPEKESASLTDKPTVGLETGGGDEPACVTAATSSENRTTTIGVGAGASDPDPGRRSAGCGAVTAPPSVGPGHPVAAASGSDGSGRSDARRECAGVEPGHPVAAASGSDGPGRSDARRECAGVEPGHPVAPASRSDGPGRSDARRKCAGVGSSKTGSADNDRKLRWVSDKLTDLPEWACFVKVYADDQ